MSYQIFYVPVEPAMPMPFVYDDGGRAAAGFKGVTGDCVVRAIAIATREPYREIYDELSQRGRTVKPSKQAKPVPSVRHGVFPKVYKPFIESLGFTWTPTMGIGTGTTVHLNPAELPPTGRHIIRCSKHLVALIDGRIHDIADHSRGGFRAVYGYWTAQ